MAVQVRHLFKSFGEHTVLRDFSIDFPDGSRTCLMGPSGCGKTTFLYLLLGLLKADRGEILYPRGMRMGAVFQENRLLEHLSAVRNLRLACGRGVTQASIHCALSQVGLEEPAHLLPVSQLSGGMARRVAIVRAMLSRSELIVMDEPLKGLDAENRSKTLDFIRQTLQGRTLVVVTHDERDPQDFDASLVRFGELDEGGSSESRI